MKLIVCAGPKGAEDAGRLRDALEKSGTAAVLRIFDPDWQSLPRGRLLELFEGATHLLLMADSESAGAGWLALALGFDLGRTGQKSRAAFFSTAENTRLPASATGLPFFHNALEAAAYYSAEAARWDGENRISGARTALLERGYPLSTESLAHCVSEGKEELVGLYLDSGCAPDSRNETGVPLLCLAARSRQCHVAKLLLERGADINLQSEDRGYSALMDAVYVGAADLAATLVEDKARLDLVSRDGQTALIIAVGRGDLECSRLLIEAGADPEIKDKLGLSARGYASLFHNIELLSLFPSPKA